jgi:hypothetical protein
MHVINLGALGQSKPDQTPLPFPSGVLYRPPNPDGSRKNCSNCILWAKADNRCTIHSKDIRVTSDLNCGYHIFGEPLPAWVDFPGIMPVTPDLSGLRFAGPGNACAGCLFYERRDNENGLCWGVANPETGLAPAPVHSRGWCSRFKQI